MVRVLHASDFHLDSAYGGLTPEQARRRRQESRDLVRSMVDYGNDHGAQLLLLAGDLLDSDAIYAQTAEELASALSAFRGEVVIAPGNHDYYTAGSPYATTLWPQNVHIFTSPAMERIVFPRYSCVVYGAAFTEAEVREAGLSGFRVRDEDREFVKIGLLHGEVGSKDSRYRSIAPEDIAKSGLDYLALGHVHRYDGVQAAGAVSYAYCGCLEGRGFDELGEKGFLLGDVGNGSIAMHFVPFARRHYCIHSVDVTGRDITAAVMESLPPRSSDDLYRIILTGEHSGEGEDLAVLKQQLSPKFYQLELRDNRISRRDIWAGCAEDSLRGLQKMKQRLEAAESDEEQRKIELAVRFGTDALDGRE